MHLKVSMSEFNGLWKHKNNPVCTESVRLFRLFKLDTIGKMKKKDHLNPVEPLSKSVKVTAYTDSAYFCPNGLLS